MCKFQNKTARFQRPVSKRKLVFLRQISEKIKKFYQNMHPKSANHERKNQVRGFEGKIICEKTLTPISSKTTQSRVSYLKRMKFKI
jgi:hypothetical protein